MQTTKKVFSSALLALAAAILLPSCATTSTTPTGPGNLKYGLPVPYHTGYVRSPYTRPAQLVNLNGAQPGEIITCPYTGIDFIVPGLTGKRFQERQERLQSTRAQRAMAVNKPKTQKPQPAPTFAPVKPVATTAPTAKPRPAATTPEPLQPRMITPSEEPITAEELLAAPAATRSEIPFGTNIPGKPGFVRSPYAAAHQIVEVSGLPVGSEVKCPYTNKIFRVPAP